MLVAALGGVILGTLWQWESGTSWIITIVLIVLGVVVLLMVLDRRMKLEHQALLSSIAVAAEKGIPLPEAVLAYSDELTSAGARRILFIEPAFNTPVVRHI